LCITCKVTSYLRFVQRLASKNKTDSLATKPGSEKWALLDYYAAWSCNSLPTFRDNLSVSSLRVKKDPWPFKKDPWPLKMLQMCPETSVRN